MLLGSQRNQEHKPATDNFVLQLLIQQRYAEAYELLLKQENPNNSTRYNRALCLHWSGNYQAALQELEQIQRPVNLSSQNPMDANRDYSLIRDRQRQTDDHLQGMTEQYAEQFPSLVQDAIVRLQTDCWLQMGDFPKVIACAKTIEHKGYKNISEALKTANSSNDERI